MSSLIQSINYSHFSSKVLSSSLQKPLEFILNIDDTNNNKEPLLVFDGETEKIRKINKKDGLFYSLCNKPPLHNKPNNALADSRLRMLVCLTMKSENKEDFETTIDGIYQNLEHFQKINICDEDIAVIVLIDGCSQISQSMLDLFKEEARISKYDNSIIPLERRREIYLNPDDYPEYANFPRDSLYMYQTVLKQEDCQHNLNVFLACKLAESGKLNSHMWFFRGFAQKICPNYCLLVDCGTKINNNTLFEFFKAFEFDKKVGGICGFNGLYAEPLMDEFGIRFNYNLI